MCQSTKMKRIEQQWETLQHPTFSHNCLEKQTTFIPAKRNPNFHNTSTDRFVIQQHEKKKL